VGLIKLSVYSYEYIAAVMAVSSYIANFGMAVFNNSYTGKKPVSGS
jgi:hypothetical protein